MTPRVVMFADDLSGGNSVGAEFARHGLDTLMVRSSQLDAVAGDAADVLVVSTDTRNRAPEEAEAILREAVTRLCDGMAGRRAGAPDIVVKKLDSLLRGPIAAEAAALMAALGAAEALVATASPEAGRTTVGGRQRAGGRPLAEALPDLDPGATLETDEVAAFFTGCGRPVRLLDLATLRAAGPLRHGWRDAITVADAETPDDLVRAVGAAHAAGIRVFFGTYGLGEAVARLLPAPRRDPLLVIAGSLSEATRTQVLALAREGAVCLTVGAPDVGPQARAALDRGEDVVLCTRPDTLGESGRRLSSPPSGNAARAMEQAVAALAESLLPGVAGVVVSGGSTADALLARIEAHGLRLTPRELGPGVPLMRVHGGPWDGLWFITKPGSFGGEDALSVARRCLRDSLPGRGHPQNGIAPSTAGPTRADPAVCRAASEAPQAAAKG
ncbi:hypothetical protein RHODGE_RHODGE_01716 [Rhodoplanes serenus]|uniref:Four-carbon acid sugar kinase family protein n=1 Tax=Rhodoplanes serenus TaxID=200615 RepID=A0A3S4B0A0_9BRAD|nr:four-carbon acid sugar kinase family protein [Rhodoplanes serenus]VCU08552.1 hypothetical protein RHODGE_RHODGE_01716 [Rhodoplanes serenus]